MDSRVLVVEDNAATLTDLVQLLEGAGYDAIGAPSFEAARHQLRAARPDLVIADIRLGAYNGLQLGIFAQSRHPGIPIIVLTGYEDPTLRKEAAASGATFLVKPVRREELLAKIATALGSQAAQ